MMFIDENDVVNVYAGVCDLPILSNLSYCKFSFNNIEFNSVEQAYMYYKAMFFKDKLIADKILSAKTAKECKRLCKKIENFKQKLWSNKSYVVMKHLIRLSLLQNRVKLKVLQNTGNSKITHIPETSKWKDDFPKILMELREELKSR